MKNKTILITALLGYFISGAYSKDQWINLFNGKDLNDWRLLNGDAEFLVEKGVIVGISKINTPNTFLVVPGEYSDFIFEYEAKIDQGLNSGVQIRSQSLPEYKNGRVHGYQMELDPSPRAWSGGIYDEARRGWLYNLECNPQAKSAFKLDQWNRFRVEAIGEHIRVWLNGIPSADVIDDLTASGFIALQVHSIDKDTAKAGKKVQWRNLRILTSNLEREKTPVTNKIPQNSYLTNQLTARERAEGWALLWDGKTTNGWRGVKGDRFPDKGWKIEDGILSVVVSNGGESQFGGDIISVKKYRNFELEVDFKFAKGANSGIKYFVDPESNKGEGSAIGCEYQILDDDNHPDAKMGAVGNRTLASLYDLIPAQAQFYAPNENEAKRINKDNWNRAKIVVNGHDVVHYLNGIKVVAYERGTQMWRALVARSKFVVWPNFGEQSEGHILLQGHGSEVLFRNIKIREKE